MSQLAELMKRRRQRKQLTQEDAAEASGIPVRSWKRYESGQGLPSAYNARALAEFLEITPEEIGEAMGMAAANCKPQATSDGG